MRIDGLTQREKTYGLQVDIHNKIQDNRKNIKQNQWQKYIPKLVK